MRFVIVAIMKIVCPLCNRSVHLFPTSFRGWVHVRKYWFVTCASLQFDFLRLVLFYISQIGHSIRILWYGGGLITPFSLLNFISFCRKVWFNTSHFYALFIKLFPVTPHQTRSEVSCGVILLFCTAIAMSCFCCAEDPHEKHCPLEWQGLIWIGYLFFVHNDCDFWNISSLKNALAFLLPLLFIAVKCSL